MIGSLLLSVHSSSLHSFDIEQGKKKKRGNSDFLNMKFGNTAFHTSFRLMQSIGKHVPEVMQRLEAHNKRLSDIFVTGEAGAGMVRTKFSLAGRMSEMSVDARLEGSVGDVR